MRRRILLVVTLAVLLVLGVASWVAVLVIMTDRDAALADRVGDRAPAFARELQSRLQMANAVIQDLSASDAGADGGLLRQRVLATEAFSGVLVTPWLPNTSEGDSAPDAAILEQSDLSVFSTTERLALSGGQSLLRVVPRADNGMTLYLAHMISAAGSREVAYFELSPDWFWRGAGAAAGATALAVVDTAGRIIFHGGELPVDAFRRFSAVPVNERDPLRAVQRDWQQDDAGWRAAIVRLDFTSAAHLQALPWNVVSYARLTDARPLLDSFALLILPMLLLACVCGGVVAWLLGRGWEPVLARLQSALFALQDGRYQRVDTEGAVDMPRVVAQSFNAALGSVEQRAGAQTRLAQIDRLLLENMDVEQSLDALLPRICAVTSMHAAALLLIDQDAPGHARAFVGGADGGEYPVTRIPIPPDVGDLLGRSRDGLSLGAAEADQYDFLAPLLALDAVQFHVWPIRIAEQLAGVLSVGTRASVPLSAAQIALGTECADRLRIALSNRARDERLYRQAHFDSLTALPNRLLFRDRLSQELASCADGSQRGAVLYIDLDHFKKVNDSVGHSAGDQLLTIVAQRLRSCVKDGDTVARLGGDEFTVILRNLVSTESANEIALRIIETVQRPVSIAGRDHYVRASIGVTLFPDDGDSIEEIMRNADLAMYQAKDGGRSRAVFYDRMMSRAQVPLARSGLFRALRRKEFALYYQPQYLLSTGELTGLEGFLRWQTQRDGLRLPKDFVPAAEESGLIVDIGAWALESACHQFAEWREQGMAPPRLALNLSVQQLRVPDFAELVGGTLQRHGLQPQQLEFEIAEAAFTEEEARQSLRQIAALGVRLVLDQFGSGEASVNYLRQYPVHALKIDRQLMQDIPRNPQAVTLVSTLIQMARGLGKLVIAEGVETMEQLEFLREHGCDCAQGYVLARPGTVTEISEILAARQAADPWVQSAAS